MRIKKISQEAKYDKFSSEYEENPQALKVIHGKAEMAHPNTLLPLSGKG